MSATEQLPFPWTPVSLPPPTTEPRRRHRPARGDRPSAPHPLRTLPPRAPGEDPGTPTAAPAPGADRAAAAVTPVSAHRVREGLTAAAAARHQVRLHQPRALADLLAVDPADLAGMVAAGSLLEVRLGAGLVRYAFTEDLPAGDTADGAA